MTKIIFHNQKAYHCYTPLEHWEKYHTLIEVEVCEHITAMRHRPTHRRSVPLNGPTFANILKKLQSTTLT